MFNVIIVIIIVREIQIKSNELPLWTHKNRIKYFLSSVAKKVKQVDLSYIAGEREKFYYHCRN